MRVVSYTNAHLVSRSPSGDLMLSSMLARKRTETLAARSPKQSTSSSSQPWGGGTGENLQQRIKDTLGNQAEIHLKSEAKTFRKLDSRPQKTVKPRGGGGAGELLWAEKQNLKLSQCSKDLKLRTNTINNCLNSHSHIDKSRKLIYNLQKRASESFEMLNKIPSQHLSSIITNWSERFSLFPTMI